MAIDDLSLTVERGELRCVIGPNGAGKTTLFNLISGHIRPDKGRILFDGELLNGMTVSQISRKGVGRKFQSPSVFEDLTVEENLMVAACGNFSLGRLARSRGDEVNPVVEEALGVIALAEKRDWPAGVLSHGEKQWLEIGMVLTGRPKLLLLDEPTAGMTPQETRKTAQLIRRISRHATTVVIEHDLKFIREIANVVTVLHHGSVLAEGPIDQIAKDPRVREAYLGSREL